jgi:hypothetical protein
LAHRMRLSAVVSRQTRLKSIASLSGGMLPL